MTRMPEYTCDKTVRAAEIVAVRVSGDGDHPCEVTVELPPHGDMMHRLTIFMPPGWHAKHEPEVGGYLVEHEDGYRSYSPRDAFEAGHTIID